MQISLCSQRVSKKQYFANAAAFIKSIWPGHKIGKRKKDEKDSRTGWRFTDRELVCNAIQLAQPVLPYTYAINKLFSFTKHKWSFVLAFFVLKKS